MDRKGRKAEDMEENLKMDGQTEIKT